MPDPVDASRLSELPLNDLVACHECDLLMRKPVLDHGEKALCPRCGYELYAHRYNVVQRSLALVIAALLLYIPANFLPIMQLNLLGQGSKDTVWSGVLGLYNSGMQGIAVVVFLCSMAIPLLNDWLIERAEYYGFVPLWRGLGESEAWRGRRGNRRGRTGRLRQRLGGEEALGHQQTFEGALRVLRPGGEPDQPHD